MAKNDKVAHSFQPLMGAHGGQVADPVIEAVMYCKVPCLDMPFYYSSAANVMIFSKAQWDKEGEMGYERKPAGTGPYIVKERQLSRYVLYERAPTPHWKDGVVDWQELQMTWTLEEPTRFAQL
jgi:ABC-type transport system substrate-binding protein